LWRRRPSSTAARYGGYHLHALQACSPVPPSPPARSTSRRRLAASLRHNANGVAATTAAYARGQDTTAFQAEPPPPPVAPSSAFPSPYLTRPLLDASTGADSRSTSHLSRALVLCANAAAGRHDHLSPPLKFTMYPISLQFLTIVGTLGLKLAAGRDPVRDHPLLSLLEPFSSPVAAMGTELKLRCNQPHLAHSLCYLRSVTMSP
jgi:hypothetical protein